MENKKKKMKDKQTRRKNQSTKKSIAKAAELQKRQSHIKILLEADDLPEYVREVLVEEEKEQGQILKLNDEDLEKLWSELAELVVQRSVEEMAEENNVTNPRVLSAVVDLLQYSSLTHDPMLSDSFVRAAILLNNLMMVDKCPFKVRDEICVLSEYCCINEFHVQGEFYLNTFNVLFDFTLNNKLSMTDLRPYVRRMWEMRAALGRINLKAQGCETIVDKLTRTLSSAGYLAYKEGRQFMAYIFTLDTKLIKKFHQAIKDFLPNCKRPQAVAYGEAYYNAWNHGSPEIRQLIETQCIQNLMSHMFVFPRKKQELSQTGQNVFAILSYLHRERSLPTFSKTLTELYMPLLWRHLRSGNNIERCNAAEIFLDVYPLERPGSGRVEESQFLDKQHSEMLDLLTDSCHIVRIIAIKGICLKLSTTWETFPSENLQVIVRNLILLAQDGSVAVVRRTLYDSLPLLLRNQQSAACLARILPSLGNFLHDDNEKVRRSFVRLLLAIKNMPEPVMPYWKISDLKHLSTRLQMDGAEVCTEISRILMSSVFTPEMKVHKSLYRIMTLINMNPVAARKLFAYSSKSLPFESALRLMQLILVNMRLNIRLREGTVEAKDVPSTTQEGKENVPDQAPVVRKKKRRSRSLESLDDNADADSEKHETESPKSAESSVSEKDTTEGSNTNAMDDYEKPGVSHGLIDIVSLLWALHSKRLTSGDHDEEHNDLQNIACMCIPIFLKYYRNTPTYFATVHLASLVPAAKLTPVSTVCSACVSHLKHMSEVTPDTEIRVILHALCAWNRFSDIQDVIIDWLDQGFRCEGLNQSKAMREGEGVRQRKVRFVAAGGKPMLALKILDITLIHPINFTRVKDKCYNLVYDLFIYMERIKSAVEKRLLSGLPLDSPMLSDEFLVACLYRYTKLIVFLHRPHPVMPRNNQTLLDPFDASDVFREFILWTIRVIEPMLHTPEEDRDFIVTLLRRVLQASTNLISLMYVQDDTVIRISNLLRSLFSSGCSLWFVESGLQVMKQIKEYTEAVHGIPDQAQLMGTVIPSLLSQVLKSLSEHKYSKEQIAESVSNLYEVKTMMFEVLKSLKSMFVKKPQFLQTILALFTDSIVAVIVHDIKQLQLLDLVSKVQELPFVCSVLLSVITKPLFCTLWLNTLPDSIINTYSRDSNVLGGVVSLLHTLARGEIKLPKEELQAAVRAAHSAVTQFSRESTQHQPTITDPTDTDTDTSLFSDEYIDVKKLALPVLNDLSTHLEMVFD